jgi:Zn-dependent peptidase ImmA (M78 family)
MDPEEVKAVIADAAASIPVDVQAAAERLGVIVYSKKLPPKISGMLVQDDRYGSRSGFVIFVEQTEPAVRQRFTAAHELGHFALHRAMIGTGITDNYLLRSEGMTNRQEVEANKFAADLLMPMDQIEKAMSRGTVTPEDLAAEFDVSKVAMSIRLGLVT